MQNPDKQHSSKLRYNDPRWRHLQYIRLFPIVNERQTAVSSTRYISTRAVVRITGDGTRVHHTGRTRPQYTFTFFLKAVPKWTCWCETDASVDKPIRTAQNKNIREFVSFLWSGNIHCDRLITHLGSPKKFVIWDRGSQNVLEYRAWQGQESWLRLCLCVKFHNDRLLRYLTMTQARLVKHAESWHCVPHEHAQGPISVTTLWGCQMTKSYAGRLAVVPGLYWTSDETNN
jgi:hypothetical protein